MMTSNDIRFYGYKHWTLEETPRCFNVGKGTIDRCKSRKVRNHKWHHVVNRFGFRVEICVGPVSENEAFIWEIENILKEETYRPGAEHHVHNTDDVGCNMTPGGEGSAGYKWSAEQRAKKQGKVPWNKGIAMSHEQRMKLSQSKKGKKHNQPRSDEWRKKLSLANKGQVPWIKGKKQSAEHIANRVKSYMANRSLSEKRKSLTGNDEVSPC